MRVQFLFLSLMLDFSAASALGPVAEFDATKGITVNERNEVEKWRDIRNTGLWSMSALGNKPLLVTANGGRSHVHFSRNQHMVLNLTTPVYIDTGITGTTLVIVIKNEYKRGSHMIFGGVDNSGNAHIRFDNPTTIRMSPPTNLFPIRTSTDAFHAYVIRSTRHTIDIYQDGALVASKRTDRAYGRDNTLMHCLGCFKSKHFLQGRVSYFSFYKYAVDPVELSAIHAKLYDITQESNLGQTPTRRPISSSDNTKSATTYSPHLTIESSSLSLPPPSMSPPMPIHTEAKNTDLPPHDYSSPGNSVIRAVNGSYVFSTQTLQYMLDRAGNGSVVVPSDTVHAAVTGIFVVGACCLIPWCVLLLCCLHKLCCSSSASYPPLRPSFSHQHYPSHHQQSSFVPQIQQKTRAWRRQRTMPQRRSTATGSTSTGATTAVCQSAYSVVASDDNGLI